MFLDTTNMDDDRCS